MSLTKDQAKALSAAMSGRNIFITGGGGVGKSFIANEIVKALRDDGKTILITAPTGRAALLIGGATCHSTFKIPIHMAWAAEPKFSKDDPLHQADVVIVDEVSMLRIDAFEYIVRAIELYNENREGKPIQLIAIGDFCQLPPVISRPRDGSPDVADLMSAHFGFDIGAGYAFSAPGWNRCDFIICELTEAMRQTDKRTVDALSRLRFGDQEALEDIIARLRKKRFPADEDGVIYLCGKKRTAKEINDRMLKKLPGNSMKYYASIAGEVAENDKMAPDLIELKKGANVMMLKNTNHYKNGSTGTVEDLSPDGVLIKIHDSGNVIEVLYTTWEIERYVVSEVDGEKKVTREVVGRYSQLPLQLGYAVTIHRAQGQTYNKMFLKPEIFAFGMLYVALSRVRDLKNLYVDGDINGIELLASPEVVEFYGRKIPVNGKAKTTPRKKASAVKKAGVAANRASATKKTGSAKKTTKRRGVKKKL